MLDSETCLFLWRKKIKPLGGVVTESGACLDLVIHSLEFCFHVRMPAGMKLVSPVPGFHYWDLPVPLARSSQSQFSHPATSPPELRAHANLRLSDS